MKLIVELR